MAILSIMLPGCKDKTNTMKKTSVSVDFIEDTPVVSVDKIDVTEELDVNELQEDLFNEILGISSNKINIDVEDMSIFNEFYALLFQQKVLDNKNNNIIISPVLTLYELGLMSKSSVNSSITEIETVLGQAESFYFDKIKHYVNAFENPNIIFGNSFWYNKENIVLDNEFAKSIKDLEYDINGTLDTKDINKWINDKTYNNIEDIIVDEKYNDLTSISTLRINAAWKNDFDEIIESQPFYILDGENTSEQKTDYLTGSGDYYYENDTFTGVSKSYDIEDRDIEFIALKPKEGYSIEESIENLYNDSFEILMDKNEQVVTEFNIPLFIFKNKENMVGSLDKLGIKTVFNKDKANLYQVGAFSERTCYSTLDQYIYYNISKTGTNDISVSMNSLSENSVSDNNMNVIKTNRQNKKVIEFNKPFIFMVYDYDNKIPVIMGVLNKVE